MTGSSPTRGGPAAGRPCSAQHLAQPGAAEGALEIGVALLLDDAKAGALVGALRRRVADEHADLRLRVAAFAAAREDGIEKRADQPLAALLRPRRHPLD